MSGQDKHLDHRATWTHRQIFVLQPGSCRKTRVWVTTHGRTEMSASGAETCQYGPAEAWGSHNIFIVWIDRQEMGRARAVIGSGRALVQVQDKDVQQGSGTKMCSGPA